MSQDFNLTQIRKHQFRKSFLLELEKIKKLETRSSSLFSTLITLEYFFSFDSTSHLENLSQNLNDFNSWCNKAFEWMKTYLKKIPNTKTNEKENLNKINSYFFEFQKFTVSRNVKLTPLDLSLKHVLKRKKGAPFLMNLIYWHLASEMKLSVHLIDFFDYPILKWIHQGETYFIDLICKGRILYPEQTLKLIQNLSLSLRGKHESYQNENERLELYDRPSSNSMETLNIKSAFKRYLELLLETLKNSNTFEKEFEKSLFILNALLKIEPSKISFLAEKAIIYKKIGQYKESLRNFRRYFSFVEKKNAPLEVQKAYKELVEINEFNIKNEVFH